MSATVQSSSSSKRRREKKRVVYIDENAPKRPRTAYVHFVNARRKELADSGEHETLRQRSFLADIGKQWKVLSDDQKKFYLDKSAKEHADYKKAMEEYKKTEAYSLFQVKKERLRKQRMQELKKRKYGVKCSDEEEDAKGGAVAGDIPIFSREFLAYNKSQESKCKKLRKMVSAFQEEKDLLIADIAKLSEKLTLFYGQQPGTVQWASKVKQRWTKLLIDALAYVSVDGEYPTLQNIDIYMQKLKKLVVENPSSKDLIAVRMALSEFISPIVYKILTSLFRVGSGYWRFVGSMGKKKKKDFPKTKVKLGKKLKKTTATDTQIRTRKVVLVEQLAKSGDSCLSYRGLSLDELCRQLGHYNINVRRDSVIGVRQLLLSHPELMPQHLHTLIPAVGRLIACDKSDSSFHAQLRALLELLCTTDASTISSHFTLLMTHTLRALTHLRMGVRLYALTILTLLMRTYPNLCRNSIDLFDSFVEFLNNKRLPLLLDAVSAFLRAFMVEEFVRVGPLHVASFSIRNKQYTRINLTPTTPMIDFCVLGSQPQQSKSPLDSPDKFLLALSGILSLFLINASDESSSNEKQWTGVFGMLKKILLRVRSLKSTVQFEEKLNKILSGINGMLKHGNLSQRLRSSLQTLVLSK
uniref:HMG box domain-containing protein n=1 Tax=Setaria digitata TaxID=48799 RepID=A0A915Q3U4_9BILA